MIIWNPWESETENIILPSHSFIEPLFLCSKVDFLSQEADTLRPFLWKTMKTHMETHFTIWTKQIEQLPHCLPEDWDNGYPNLTFGCVCETQEQVKQSLPYFLQQPICHREIVLEPILEQIDLFSYLDKTKIKTVVCGGESGSDAHQCDYQWILDVRKQCIVKGIDFCFHRTGSIFMKDGNCYHIPPQYEFAQAKKANIDYLTADEMAELFRRLGDSKFRSGFSLKGKDLDYLQQKGMDVIEQHARDFIKKRLAPGVILNDGKQTPMRGHPVFVAQHATGTCCRGCLSKWHQIPPGAALTQEEQRYVVSVIMEWIRQQAENKL